MNSPRLIFARVARSGMLAVCLGVSLIPAGAHADEHIYRAVESGGEASYSSQPDPSDRVVGKVKVDGATPEQAATQQRFQQDESNSALVADAYAANLENKWVQVDRDITQALSDLQLAESALQDGLEPLPGERLGVEDGDSRLGPAYFERVGDLRREVTLAQHRLDAAYRARDQLK